MDFFGLSSGSIIALVVGVIVGTVIMKVFGTAVTRMILTKNQQGRDMISWTGILLIDLLTAGIMYYFRADLASYLHSTPFLPTFVTFVLLYLAVLIWYFKIQRKELIKKNMRWFTFLSLLSLGLFIFFFNMELQMNFGLGDNILFLTMIGSFIGAFFIYYKRINKKQSPRGTINV